MKTFAGAGIQLVYWTVQRVISAAWKEKCCSGCYETPNGLPPGSRWQWPPDSLHCPHSSSWAHGCRRSRQDGTEHRSTSAFILQTSLQLHLSGSALPLPLHLVFCRSPSVAVNLHFVLFLPAVHRCFHSSSLRRNLTFVLYPSFLLLTGHQLYFPTPVSLPTSLYCLNSASAESQTCSLLHPPASLSKQPRRCSRASKCRSGKGWTHRIAPTTNHACHETPVHAFPLFVPLVGRGAFLCLTKSDLKIKYK